MRNEATAPVLADSCGKTTILMVQSHTIVRAFSSEALRNFGYHVIEAVNADEAVALLRQLRVDIVITGLDMPGSIDGAGLVRLIRTDCPFLRIAILSGELPDQMTLSRVDRYFRKPVNLSDLNDSLQAWLPSSADDALAR